MGFLRFKACWLLIQNVKITYVPSFDLRVFLFYASPIMRMIVKLPVIPSLGTHLHYCFGDVLKMQNSMSWVANVPTWCLNTELCYYEAKISHCKITIAFSAFIGLKIEQKCNFCSKKLEKLSNLFCLVKILVDCAKSDLHAKK